MTTEIRKHADSLPCPEVSQNTVIIASFLITGCTRYANEEELTTLDETQAAVESSDKKVEDLKQEKAELEQTLADKKVELEEVKAEKERVESKL